MQPITTSASRSNSAPQLGGAAAVDESKELMKRRSGGTQPRSSFHSKNNLTILKPEKYDDLIAAARSFSVHASASDGPKMVARQLAESMTAKGANVGELFDAWIACCKSIPSQNNLLKMHLGMQYK
jgi:hypothetical protein